MKNYLFSFSSLLLILLLSGSTDFTNSEKNSSEVSATIEQSLAIEGIEQEADCPFWYISGASNVYLGSTFAYSLQACGQTQFDATFTIHPSTGTTMTSTSSGVNVTFLTSNQNTSHVLVARINGQIKATKTVYPDIEL